MTRLPTWADTADAADAYFDDLDAAHDEWADGTAALERRPPARTFRNRGVPFIPDPWDEVDAEMRAADAEKEAS